MLSYHQQQGICYLAFNINQNETETIYDTILVSNIPRKCHAYSKPPKHQWEHLYTQAQVSVTDTLLLLALSYTCVCAPIYLYMRYLYLIYHM